MKEEKGNIIIVILKGKAWTTGLRPGEFAEYIGCSLALMYRDLCGEQTFPKRYRYFIDYAIPGVDYPKIPGKYCSLLKGERKMRNA